MTEYTQNGIPEGFCEGNTGQAIQSVQSSADDLRRAWKGGCYASEAARIVEDVQRHLDTVKEYLAIHMGD